MNNITPTKSPQPTETPAFQFVTLSSELPFPRRATFLEAWDDMFKHVKNLMALDQLSHQVLETAMWINTPNDNTLDFYAGRDCAIDLFGWTMPVDTVAKAA